MFAQSLMSKLVARLLLGAMREGDGFAFLTGAYC